MSKKYGKPGINLAFMGSGSGSVFEAAVKHFSDIKIPVEITCISNVRNAHILECARKLNIKAEYVPFEKNFEYFSDNKFDLTALAYYTKNLQPEVLKLGMFINIHPSLLPAFKGKDAIRHAFLAGVKVSGVTAHRVEDRTGSGRIIAQYPVLIGNLTHFDEFEAEIHKIEHALYPVVIEKILHDEVFDFSDLLGAPKPGCGGCGGCGGN
ncbi:MAG: hypothetical protein LBK53_01750 [Heliobacteriaceae bacterium]|jgi:phosphoribosylglycinamide formyltransferase-1|nr:hypothetical protein [Heliobacteriaceae bacterium]